ncbi:MAG TPA: T9SS type A sorting domain-containing protein [Bacteroidetes bacterium]|nr:T9SS type A sorting domain-containing protein [Bacteroidota bacterium]
MNNLLFSLLRVHLTDTHTHTLTRCLRALVPALFFMISFTAYSQCPRLPAVNDFGIVTEMMVSPLANCTPVTMSIQLANDNPPECESDPVDITIELFFISPFQQSHFTIVENPNGFVFVSSGNTIPNESFGYDLYTSNLTVPGKTDTEGILDVGFTVISTAIEGEHNIYFRIKLPDGTISEYFLFDLFSVINYHYIVGDSNLPPSTEFFLSDFTRGPEFNEMLTPAQSQVSGQHVLINNTLVIDEDYFISEFSNFALKDNASIVIRSGRTLTIDKGPGNINPPQITGCTGMWDRIEVEDNATLIVREATIKDGLNGIVMDGKASLHLTDATLLNNNRSIRSSGNSNALNIPVFVISGLNAITSDGQMLSPLEGQIPGWGMDMENTNFRLIGDASNNIAFSNLQNGIELTNCNATIEKMLFRNSAAGAKANFAININTPSGSNRSVKYVGYGTGSFDFENWRAAVVSKRTNLDFTETSMKDISYGFVVQGSQNKKLDIKNNEIIASKDGVRLFQNMPVSLNLKDNLITVHDATNTNGSATGIGIRAEENFSSSTRLYKIENNGINVDNAQTGIWFQAGKWPLIRRNTVNLKDPNRETYFGIDIQGAVIPWAFCNEVNGNGSPANWKSAIAINSVGSSDGRLRCNSVNNSDIGLNFQNLQDAMILKGNIINEHRLGLQINPGAFIGTQSHRGNLWLGSSYGNAASGGMNGGFGAFNGSSPELSVFIIDEPENAAFNTSTNVSGWFDNNPTSTPSYSCVADNGCPFGIGTDLEDFNAQDPCKFDVLDQEIINGGPGHDLCRQELNWTGKRRLYRRWTEKPGECDADPNIKNFLDAEALTTIGQFHQIEKGIAGLFETDEATTALLETQQSSINAGLHSLYGIDSTLAQGGLTAAEEAALQQQKEVQEASLNSEMATNDALQASLQTAKEATAQQLLTDNAAIPATTTPGINEQTVNAIFLETIAVGNDVFSPQQSSQLFAIAKQCPTCGGDAVYRARSMYALVDDKATFTDVICDGTGSRSSNGYVEEDGQGSGFAFSPNPASDHINIAVGDDLEEMDRELVVHSLTGKVIFKQLLSAKTSSYRISTAMLMPGSYFVSIYENGKKLVTEQIVIIK